MVKRNTIDPSSTKGYPPVNKHMAINNGPKTNVCKLFSELPNSDGGNVFEGLKQSRISADDVKDLKSSQGKPLVFQLRLHLASYPDLPAQVMDKLNLTATDRQGNNFLHELATSVNSNALSMIRHLPEETKQLLCSQPNHLGFTPEQLAKRLNNTAFLNALN